MIRFYTDEHIHRTVARQLQQRGIDILRCQDAGMLHAQDIDHLIFATEQQRTVVTGDADFLRLATEYWLAGKHHTGIVRISNEKLDRLGVIIEYLAFLYDAVEGGAADLETDVFDNVLHF